MIDFLSFSVVGWRRVDLSLLPNTSFLLTYFFRTVRHILQDTSGDLPGTHFSWPQLYHFKTLDLMPLFIVCPKSSGYLL